MRIRQLHINRFGHFTECDLTFAGDGLQIIYGPNEAGKTTLLEFLRGLLFDFPVRSRYDFGGPGEVSGVATLQMRDGRLVELRRRKGYKDKVAIKIDGQPTDLDDIAWLKMLDHADRGLFESVFAFGLDQLSQGEEGLKHEILQSALFGGSLGGLSSPDRILAELGNQADELFKKTGQKPAINVLLTDIRKLAKQIKETSLRPEKFHDAERELAAAVESARQCSRQLDQLRREHAKIDKLVRAWPKWWEVQQLRKELASLSAPAGIPVDARQRYLAIVKECETNAGQRSQLAREIGSIQERLEALRLDPRALARRAEIKSCLELRQSYIDAKTQLPERRIERESMRRLVDSELAHLRPGWSHGDLQAFSVDIATQDAIESFIDKWRERASRRTELYAKRDSDVASRARATEELAELGEPAQVDSLADALAEESDFVAHRKRLEDSREELRKTEHKLTSQLLRLATQVSADPSAVAELPVPRAETVARFRESFNDLDQQLRTMLASVQEDEAEMLQVESALAAAVSKRAVPSLSDRDAARARRDELWRFIRARHLDGAGAIAEIHHLDEPIPEAELPDHYEVAVHRADEVTDEIYENASEVAQREVLRQRLSAGAARIDQKRWRIADQRKQQSELQSQWRALWQPCGFEPLSPTEMLGWLKDHEGACSTVAAKHELVQEQASLVARMMEFEKRLRTALPTTDDIQVLIVAARRAVEQARQQQRRIAELTKESRRLEKQVSGFDAALRALTATDAEENEEWQGILKRLNLPADWDAELAREVIDKLRATRRSLEGMPIHEERIAAMQERVDHFEKRVQALCRELSPELIDEASDLAIKKLDDQAARAEDAQRKWNEFAEKLETTKSQLLTLDDRSRQLVAERGHWLEMAGAANESEFLEIVDRAQKCFEANQEVERLSRDIENIRAADDGEEFERSLAGSELTQLQGQRHDLQEALSAAEGARKVADGDEAVQRKALEQLRGSGEAAKLAEELSRKRSLMAAEVDRYMPLVYARYLLIDAVRRFEKENQPKMIATVSRLLGQMTGGEYVEFDRSGGAKQSLLIRQPDGVEKTPEQLSTGTREQLYLAIRLAYVLHYCEQNEPLPIVVDDVLVNFDERRTRQTLAALAEISATVQVLLFTCHPHIVAGARSVAPELAPIEL